MRSNKEVLDNFGKLIIENIYDDGLSSLNQIITGTTAWGRNQDLVDFFKTLSDSDKQLMENYARTLLRVSLFAFLGIFEEQEDYKLIYQENDKQINLVEISEMLKSELHGSDGWIERFSKFS
ncbi:hypothetical protein LCL86_01230 [Muricauda ruestringensis]|nr:hypothetical protein [Allomuricauda ruestringensis]MCA0957647.1 hypothetical protein [Allomuricauda ruestringensis]